MSRPVKNFDEDHLSSKKTYFSTIISLFFFLEGFFFAF
ncbi:hypothetical protein Cabys_664 [Caldithrix abyssi DSM 13497]|uniref:Uncharacterized protein n=1 Tax=Caldithrix abyssi DSM 13497 TaxID=880073 RepID=A0A1J1C429_CALAY|nr:hypothetical protein Cabys_664 [Caldithrix abyssi DSM 13497]